MTPYVTDRGVRGLRGRTVGQSKRQVNKLMVRSGANKPIRKNPDRQTENRLIITEVTG